MYASHGYRKEVNCIISGTSGKKKADMRSIELKPPMALGILLNCVPNRCEPRSYRKEVNSIVPKERKKAMYRKMAWKDSVTTVAVFIHHQGYGKG